MLVPDKAITHAGKFHADDVFSAAFLKILNQNIQIERVAKVPDVYSGLVFDIGLGKYDHHQAKNECRKNGVPYASFGKLWREFAPLVFSPYIVKTIDKELVQPIDAADNGKGFNLLSVFISRLNPNWNEDEYEYHDENFNIAVSIAYSILKCKIKLEKKLEEKTEKRTASITDINAAVNYIFAKPFMDTVINVHNGKYQRDIQNKIIYETKKTKVYDEKGVMCSSISNVWDEYGTLITFPSVSFSVKRSFIEPINEIIRKNYKQDLLISLFYELMQYDEKFKEYLYKVIRYWIKTEINNAESKIVSRDILCKAIRETDDDEIIVLEKFCPWRDVIIDSLAKFVVYPSARGGYDMHTVPISKTESSARLSYPNLWCASLLEAQKDIPDITFCHKGNFLLTSKSLEGCYKVAEISSENYVHNYFSSEEVELLELIRNNNEFFEEDFIEKVKRKVNYYDEEMLEKIIEKLSHIYFRNKKEKRNLVVAIKALKKEKDNKEFERNQNLSLDEILNNYKKKAGHL